MECNVCVFSEQMCKLLSRKEIISNLHKFFVLDTNIVSVALEWFASNETETTINFWWSFHISQSLLFPLALIVVLQTCFELTL